MALVDLLVSLVEVTHAGDAAVDVAQVNFVFMRNQRHWNDITGFHVDKRKTDYPV